MVHARTTLAAILAALVVLLAPAPAARAQVLSCTTVDFAGAYDWDATDHGLPHMAGYYVRQLAGEYDSLEIRYRISGGSALFGIMGPTYAQLQTDLAYIFRDSSGDAVFEYCTQPAPTSTPTSAPATATATSTPTSAPAPTSTPTSAPATATATSTPTSAPATTATSTPTSAPAPTSTPTSTSNPPTAPCYAAALAALTKRGALYSQGGNLEDDPIQPDGTPYGRTGPNSFDCSGLVWWSYAQAGISVGLTSYDQITDGAAIPCTLADLAGVNTTCWALGDLIFLRYTGGQHVAIYVGAGLFMDCYNHTTGCILHDVSSDSFYAAHFAAARRIVSGCEGLSNSPGQPQAPDMTPAIETIPNLIASVSLVLPWQCGECAPDGQAALQALPEPDVSWYDLGSWFNWLGVQLWNRSALPIICWLLAIAQAMLNSLGELVNFAIVPALNWILRILILSVLFMRESVLALLAAYSDLRQQLWLLLAPLARLSDLAGLLALAQDLVSLVLLVVDQLGALIQGVTQAFGYLVALVYSLAAALVGAILAPTPPAPLAALNTFFLFVWFRDTFQAVADSKLGWAWAAFVAIVYLRFALWLLKEAGSLNS